MNDLLLFLLILGVLITGHEVGHFVAMRARGIRVQEFGIGFPPRLFTLFWAGATRVTVNLIPLGGFVRPAGDDDPSVPDGLAGASKTSRTIVLLAGPAANVVIGFLAFTSAFRFAAPDPNRILITGVAPGSPAESAGLRPGDIISTANDQPITDFASLQRVVAASLDQPMQMDVFRDGNSLTLAVTPRSEHPETEGPIGITLGNPILKVGWWRSAQYGFASIVLQVDNLIHLPTRLLQGQIDPEEARVSGLKGMYDMLVWAGEIDRTAQRPFVTLNLVGVISVGLALANLLPFPALDGGRLVFVAYEALFRRRIAPRYEGLANAIGFLLLLILMAYVNIQDFTDPLVLPR
ncbi:MAG TPA: M50 family metallopeptidase [Anaerolineales bacterium]|nr:M50 family metallopeptidase [Anaerolineales bacterium]